ncbi:MAG: hypothetical protein JXR10_15535 [Cyclobacteriaceae bacterium]
MQIIKSNLTPKLLVAFVLFALLMFGYQKSIGQSMQAAGYLNQTVMGLQKGYEFKLVNQKGFATGVFYQSTNNFSFERSEENYPFAGASIQVPLSRCNKVRIFGEMKVGLVNNHFLIATPEITIVCKIFRHVDFAFSAGMRSQEASITAKLILTTF